MLDESQKTELMEALKRVQAAYAVHANLHKCSWQIALLESTFLTEIVKSAQDEAHRIKNAAQREYWDLCRKYSATPEPVKQPEY
jgi:hypothetical protein